MVVSEQVLALWDSHRPGAGELRLGEIAWMEEPVAPDTTVPLTLYGNPTFP